MLSHSVPRGGKNYNGQFLTFQHLGDLFGRKHFELSLEEKKLRLSFVLFEKIEFLYTDFLFFILVFIQFCINVYEIRYSIAKKSMTS